MPCEILLPRELIELILLYCDGQTLCAAQHVNREWKDIVNYLDKVKGLKLNFITTIIHEWKTHSCVS